MKKVYMIMVDTWDDGFCTTQVPYIHETLEGAKERYREVVWSKTANYVLEHTGGRDTSDDCIHLYGITRTETTDPDGTMHYKIECGKENTAIFVHIWEKSLLP